MYLVFNNHDFFYWILGNAMTKVGMNWKWPTNRDEIWYNCDEVIAKIPPPVQINKRGIFLVERLKKL